MQALRELAEKNLTMEEFTHPIINLLKESNEVLSGIKTRPDDWEPVPSLTKFQRCLRWCRWYISWKWHWKYRLTGKI